MKATVIRRTFLVLFAAFLLTCAMVFTASAEETYVLDLNITMYDDQGEQGNVGIKAYLAPGTPIVLADLIDKYPTVAEALDHYVLDADTVVGLPADGLMPARNVTVNATYTEIKSKYSVIFKYGHNTVLPTLVEHGQAAKAPTNTDKAPTETTVFEFTGWDVDFSNVTKDLIVTAQYTETDRLYTVTFQYGDGKSETVSVKYGASAQAPTDTDKAATETVTYTFKGWDAEFSEVTADMTVHAVYEEVSSVTLNIEALQAAVSDYKAAGLDTAAEVLTKAEAALTDDTLTQDEIDALVVSLRAAIDAANQDSDTDKADTTQPEDPTEDPEEPTEEPTKATDEEDTTAAPTPDTETDRETASDTDEKKGMQDWMWLIVVNVIIGAICATVLILIRRTADSKRESTKEPEEKEMPMKEAPLFIPLGEDIPEEEVIPEEIETLDEVSAETVDELMTDTLAEALLEESEEMGGNGKLGIINIGVISPVYQAGDVVTLANLQEKGLVDANIGRLKVLASGTLDKPLTIKAEAFSFQAIKMITLTGGHAIHLKTEK